MKVKEYKKIIVEKETNVTTKIACDCCGKDIKEKERYIELYLGSIYPEDDGNDYQFCSMECLGEFIKKVRDIGNYNSITFTSNTFIKPKEVKGNDKSDRSTRKNWRLSNSSRVTGL